MDVEIISDADLESPEKISEQILELLSSGKKVVLFLREGCGKYDDFLEERLGCSKLDLSLDQLELYYFSRNISLAVEIERVLCCKGIEVSVMNRFESSHDDSPEGMQKLLESLRKQNTLFDKSSVSIVCLLTREPFSEGAFVEIESPLVFTGAVILPDVVEVCVCFGDNFSLMANELFRELAYLGVSLDMINICHNELYFICSSKDKAKVEGSLASRDYIISEELVKFSLIGLGMKGAPGIIARIYSAFERRGIHILRTTDSHTSISCLINSYALKDAINLVCEDFSIPSDRIISGF